MPYFHLGCCVFRNMSVICRKMQKELSIFPEALRDRMYRYARTLLGDSDEAMDAVQDVMERLWKRRSVWRDIRNPEAFMMRSVRNSCIDRLESRRTVNVSGEVVQMAEAERWSDVQLVRSAMAELPEKQRTVLYLKDIEGYRTEEIAEMLEIKENQTRVILSRARKALKNLILEEINR